MTVINKFLMKINFLFQKRFVSLVYVGSSSVYASQHTDEALILLVSGGAVEGAFAEITTLKNDIKS